MASVNSVIDESSGCRQGRRHRGGSRGPWPLVFIQEGAISDFAPHSEDKNLSYFIYPFSAVSTSCQDVTALLNDLV